jgi:hypothetical protein
VFEYFAAVPANAIVAQFSKPFHDGTVVSMYQAQKSLCRLAAGKIALTCLIACPSGCNTAGGGSGYTVPANREAFSDFYANTVCPSLQSCCSTQLAWGTLQQCHDWVVAGMASWPNEGIPASGYNRDAAQRCLDLTLQALSTCVQDAQQMNLRFLACSEVFYAHAAKKGEACDSVPCDNISLAMGGDGLRCLGPSGSQQCRDDLVVTIGEPCDTYVGSSITVCDASVGYCSDIGTPVCTAYIPIGQKNTGSCAPGSAQADDGICQMQVNEGGTCGLCTHTAYCMNDTCVPRKSAGEACDPGVTNMCLGSCVSGICKGNATLPQICYNSN